MENGTGIFEDSFRDLFYSFRESSKRPDINSIFKAVVKDNVPNIDIHSVGKEVRSQVLKVLRLSNPKNVTQPYPNVN